MMKVLKRNGKLVEFDINKIKTAITKAFDSLNETFDESVVELVKEKLKTKENVSSISVETIQDFVERSLMERGHYAVAKAFILWRNQRMQIRKFVKEKMDFIGQYKESSNTANATVDDNSNVGSKNIGVLNAEIHKNDNIQINRAMIMEKLKEIYPDFDSKQYSNDLSSHIIYKNDESSFAGAIAPYCASITMYPFLTDGIRGIGGLSAAPKNLDSFCGMYINLIFATSAMFAGAIATSEFLLYFDYFARKEWGDNYWQNPNTVISTDACKRKKTIKSQIHQHWQQVVYSICQPAAARGLQSAFVNFSYFDRPFFEGMFGHFMFPDETQPKWESVCWLQKEFMQWFNEERLRCMLSFPVESVTLLYKDGEFLDKDMAQFVAEEYARGHSFFTYISDTVDSLSSCCRLRNQIQTKEFNFTNGNIGIQTGSKSVISLNLSRICQIWAVNNKLGIKGQKLSVGYIFNQEKYKADFESYLKDILDRVYMYHNSYNEILHDMYNANLLPVYSAGFINLDKQYLTVGLNGLNQAAEYFGIECTDNQEYKEFCQFIFGFIKNQNALHKTKKTTFNTEQVPAESLAIKNYNWDAEDGFWVPNDTNLYASYVFKPNSDLNIYEKIRLHGSEYIGDYLDGGAAAHLNLKEHLSAKQYMNVLHYCAEHGCQYVTFNVPNSQCSECGFIAKRPLTICPKCGSHKIEWYDRIIGYLSKISNWSEGRKYEYDHYRIFMDINDIV